MNFPRGLEEFVASLKLNERAQFTAYATDELQGIIRSVRKVTDEHLGERWWVQVYLVGLRVDGMATYEVLIGDRNNPL